MMSGDKNFKGDRTDIQKISLFTLLFQIFKAPVFLKLMSSVLTEQTKFDLHSNSGDAHYGKGNWFLRIIITRQDNKCLREIKFITNDLPLSEIHSGNFD